MAKTSAGLLMFRRTAGGFEVLLVHPGGPFWKNKDAGAWTIPKGEYTAGEEAQAAAIREFTEETGFVPAGPFFPLGQVRQAAGKLVTAWAFAGDCDPAALRSNSFDMEWPPRSGQIRQFPEVDRAEWFTPAEARIRILKAQIPFVDRLAAALQARRG